MEQQIKEFETLTELLEDLEREGITGRAKKTIIDRFMIERAVAKKIPYAGSFELTPLCNLDCKMCYVHLSKSQMDRGLLTTDQWIDIMGQAVDAGMMNAEITGGECLTHPGFKDIYLYLQSRGIRVAVLSNGVLMTEEMVSFFAQHRPAVVQTTLYGSNEEAYERITGHRVFSQVIEGIERLRKAGIRVKVSVTPNSYTADDILPTIKLLRSMKIEYAVSGGTLIARPETGRLIQDYQVDQNILIDVQKDEKKYRFAARREETEDITYKVSAKGMPTGGVPCTSGRSSFHVNWRGEMNPCIAFSEIVYPIFGEGFAEAWKKINQKMSAFIMPEECASCANADVCRTCPAERTRGIYNGSLNKEVCHKLELQIQAGFFDDI